jgi:probable F420-dependent oxidoreductase
MRVIYHLRSTDLRSAAAEAAWAESMGYDGIASNETAHDPFLPLTLAATSTSSVTLESHAAIAFPRSPMVLAYTARDLQDLSRGRFRLGLGTQVKGHIERRFSTRWESPGPKLREYVQSLKHIWERWQQGRTLDFPGKFYRFSLMPPFFSPGPSGYPHPAIFTAGVNPYNCRVAGEVSDGLLLHSLTSPEYLQKVIKPNIVAGAKLAGRGLSEVRLSGGGFIITGPSESALQAGREEVRRRIAFYASTRTYTPVLECHGFQEVGQRLHEMSVKGQWSDMSRQVSDEMLDAFATSGVYEEIADKVIHRYSGLVQEVNFPAVVSSATEERQLKRAIRQLHGHDEFIS